MVIICCSISFNALADTKDLSISGAYFGGYNRLSPTNQRSQFDFSTNIDLEFQFQQNIKGIIQLQSGPGGGSLGFVGPGAEVTDINIEYTHQASKTIITMGSFDLPFGIGTNALTNNADAFNSPFILNSLTYSALAGPVGTLNTLGFKAQQSFYGIETTAVISNGTGENAANYGNQFLGLLSIGSHTIINGGYIGATYTTSDDAPDTRGDSDPDVEINSFITKFSAWIIDLNVPITTNFGFNSHIGMMRFDDNNPATKDDVSIISIESKLQLTELFLSARYSHWSPTDRDGNGSGVSSDMRNPGFGLGSATDVAISRWQLGIGFDLEENLMARADLIMDDYSHGNDVSGIVLGLNGRF